jgi:hypothetical protein
MAIDDKYALGLQYATKITLTQLIPRDEQGKPSVNEKVYLDKVYVSYIDSGPMEVQVRNLRSDNVVNREIRSDYGTSLGSVALGTTLDQRTVYTETGRRQVFARGRSEDIEISLDSVSHLGMRIAAISQTGTIVPQI